MKKRPNHLHKYKRIKLGKEYTVYRCTDAFCSHYIRVELAEGKACRCNRCDQPMIMTKKAMTLARPHCESCTKPSKDTEVLNQLGELLDNI